MSSLSERMSALKLAHDTRITSELHNTPTHIFVLLEIYNKAYHECYIDYMEGFSLLTDWLCPTSKELSIPFMRKLPKAPRLSSGYDAVQVARILTVKKLKSNSHPDYLASLAEVCNLIAYYCAKTYERIY